MKRPMTTTSLLKLALEHRGEVLQKAVPAHLMPKKIVTRQGVLRTYYVRPFDAEQQRARAKQAAATIRAASTVKAWSENPVADHLTPQDRASLMLVKRLDDWANVDLDHDDWDDPVGQGPREVRAITNPKMLADIKQRLAANRHEIDVELIAAFELHYAHEGFDRKAREVGNIAHLYHGVNSDRAAAVVATGLKSPREVGETTGAMFGPGIYFADEAGKSAQYIGRGGYGRRNGSVGILLECDVVLGQTYEAVDKMQGLTEDGIPLDSDGHPIEPGFFEPWSDVTGQVDLNQLYKDTDWDNISEAAEFLVASGRMTDGSELTFDYLDGGTLGKAAFRDTVSQYAGYDDDDEGRKSREIVQQYAQAVENDEVLLNWNAEYGSNGIEMTWGDSLGPVYGRFQRWAEEAGYSDEEIEWAEGDLEQISDKFLQNVERALDDAWANSPYPERFKEELAPEPTEDSPTHFHSVRALAQKNGGHRLEHDEYVVYDPDQVKIRRVLMVRRS